MTFTKENGVYKSDIRAIDALMVKHNGDVVKSFTSKYQIEEVNGRFRVYKYGLNHRTFIKSRKTLEDAIKFVNKYHEDNH